MTYTVDNTVGYIDDALYQRLFPAAELWRAGAIIAGGSDYPVDPLLPMVQIETALDHTGEAIPGVFPATLSPQETVDHLLAVIKMHTINAAYQLHMTGTRARSRSASTQTWWFSTRTCSKYQRSASQTPPSCRRFWRQGGL